MIRGGRWPLDRRCSPLVSEQALESMRAGERLPVFVTLAEACDYPSIGHKEGPVAGSHRPRAYVQAKPAGGQTGHRDDPAE